MHDDAFALAGRTSTVHIFSPGCRYALPWAMCSLPFQGAHSRLSDVSELAKLVYIYCNCNGEFIVPYILKV